MISEFKISQKGTFRDLISGITPAFVWRNRGNHENIIQESRSPGWNFNPGPTEYEILDCLTKYKQKYLMT
jgi:hypothetical protein